MPKPVKYEDSGKRISRLFRASGISQAELARRADVSRPTVNGWLDGTVRPTLDNAEVLGAILGAPPSEIAGFEGEMSPSQARSFALRIFRETIQKAEEAEDLRAQLAAAHRRLAELGASQDSDALPPATQVTAAGDAGRTQSQHKLEPEPEVPTEPGERMGETRRKSPASGFDRKRRQPKPEAQEGT